MIVRGGQPLFYRQKSTTLDAVDDAQEIRLSLSYYTETFGGTTAPPPLFVLDEAGGETPYPEIETLVPTPLGTEMLDADSSLALHAKAHPEVFAAAAAALEPA
jgi:hypothetical protein